MIRVGCSGWSYAHWRGVLYPTSGSTRHWLATYAQSFDTVEINATFYRLPDVSTVERWAAMTPPSFLFAVKASRYLTHVRRLQRLEDGLRLLEERIEPLRRASKLGPVLWQLPRTFVRDTKLLAAALEALTPARHAFEFRDESWFVDDVYELLKAHDAALVVADRAPGPPSPCVPTADWSYVRFHAGRGRDGTYTPRQLHSWADRLEPAPGDVYAYFNNDWQGFAVDNARVLRDLVDASSNHREPQRRARSAA